LSEKLFFDPADWKYVLPQPVGTLSVQLFTPADQAVRDIMAFAGAFPRDAADTRVLQGFLSCGGSIIDNPSQVGGWPALAGGTAYTDADVDGMDDNWEKSRGISSAHADADGDGYTNLEEFLNELAGDQDFAGNFISRVGAGSGSLPPVNCNIIP
jgi:hypothetical protein